jgi:hypothetical protein
MPRVLPQLFNINGMDVKILYNCSKTGTTYIPLLVALIERLTNDQISSMIWNHPRTGDAIINYDDVVQCFESVDADNVMDYGDASTKCICGVPILTEYWIYNKSNPIKQHRIGCECIKHWSEKEYKKIDQQKKRMEDPDATFCVQCGRKNNKKSCGCKTEIATLKRDIFNKWKLATQLSKQKSGKCELLGLGKYKQMTCYAFIISKNPIVNGFREWVMHAPNITGLALTKRIALSKYSEHIAKISTRDADDDNDTDI